MIASGEDRFVSPLFQYDKQGNVTCLLNAALAACHALGQSAETIAKMMKDEVQP